MQGVSDVMQERISISFWEIWGVPLVMYPWGDLSYSKLCTKGSSDFVRIYQIYSAAKYFKWTHSISLSLRSTLLDNN